MSNEPSSDEIEFKHKWENELEADFYKLSFRIFLLGKRGGLQEAIALETEKMKIAEEILQN